MDINKIKEFVGDDKLEKAFEYCKSILNGKKELREYLNELTLLESKYNAWGKGKRLGIENQEYLDTTISKIRFNLLEVIDQISKNNGLLENDIDFDKYVQPLHTKLMIVHDNWLKSFLGYREFVSNNGKLDLKEFIETIQKDSLYSRKERIDVKIQLSLISEISELRNYNWRVNDYMRLSSNLNPEYIASGENPRLEEMRVRMFSMNSYRRDLADSINYMEYEDSQKNANQSINKRLINRIDDLVIFLHEKYENVELEYQKLRTM